MCFFIYIQPIYSKIILFIIICSQVQCIKQWSGNVKIAYINILFTKKAGTLLNVPFLHICKIKKTLWSRSYLLYFTHEGTRDQKRLSNLPKRLATELVWTELDLAPAPMPLPSTTAQSVSRVFLSVSKCSHSCFCFNSSMVLHSVFYIINHI